MAINANVIICCARFRRLMHRVTTIFIDDGGRTVSGEIKKGVS